MHWASSLTSSSAWVWVLLLWLSPSIFLSTSAQNGFISIDCGGEGTVLYHDTNDIEWVPDGSFMTVGFPYTIKNSTLLGSISVPLRTSRFFPSIEPNKFCYSITPVVIGSSYLVRASFLHGDYQGNTQTSINFDLLLEADKWASVSILDKNGYLYHEAYMTAQRSFVDVCVVRTGPDIPFISSIELRSLSDTMVPITIAKKTNSVVYVKEHTNLGALNGDAIRYPYDKSDRIWSADTTLPRQTTTSSIELFDATHAPIPVMQTAYGFSGFTNANLVTCTSSIMPAGKYLAIVHFAEITTGVAVGDRVFNITIDGNLVWENFDIVAVKGGSFKAITVYNSSVALPYSEIRIKLQQTSTSRLAPLLNAIEFFQISDRPVNITTSSNDVEALIELKKSLGVSSWTGDPCVPVDYAYSWVTCSTSSPPRITSLRLKNKNLSGTLSPHINSLKELTEINFEGCNLTGNIPNLDSLKKLQKLYLQNNHLSGAIPDSLGDIPALVELSSGNPYLCNDICAPNPPTNSNSSSSSLSSTSSSSKALLLIVIVAVVSVIIVFLIIALTVYYFHRRKPNPEQGTTSTDRRVSMQEVTPEAPPLDRHQLLYNFEDIKNATKKSAEEIGDGGFGKVYRGKLNGDDVAVKVCSQNSQQCEQEFLTEVEVLSKVYHKNIVAFKGYCEEPNLILIYEYMSNGSLRKHLDESSLDWKTRLNIAFDAAQGLQYLHKSCQRTIIHRDVKSMNILLNEKMHAKVGDFGLSRMYSTEERTHVSTLNVMGSIGYIDPEYPSTFQLTDKSDVYSFGVVLLEIISGRAPTGLSYPKNENIVHWARTHFDRRDMKGMMDPKMGEGDYSNESAWEVIDIAMKCVQFSSQERPNMTTVVSVLERAISIEGNYSTASLDESSTSLSITKEFSNNQSLYYVRAR